jgi:hypothetical protein
MAPLWSTLTRGVLAEQMDGPGLDFSRGSGPSTDPWLTATDSALSSSIPTGTGPAFDPSPTIPTRGDVAFETTLDVQEAER